MEIREEVKKPLDDDTNMDEDQADMLTAAPCLLTVVPAATAVKKAIARKIVSEEEYNGRVYD